MDIKRKKRAKRFSSERFPFRLNISRKSYVIFIVFLFFVSVLMFSQRKMLAFYSKAIFDNYDIIRLIPNYLNGLSAKPEKLNIHLGNQAYGKLAKKRADILMSKGPMILNSADEFVPALIGNKGKNCKAKLRLKGDLPDHLETDKWSFRIKVKGEETILGMKSFSIQHPKTRNYLMEWLFQKAMKYTGGVSLRYSFIQVNINGVNKGIYALEEHFEKRFVENNRLREGPIIRLDENLSLYEGKLWWSNASLDSISVKNFDLLTSGYGHYFSVPVDSFKTKKTLKDPVLFSQYKKAFSLFEGFRRGELKASEVFDVDKMSSFLALCDLFGAIHALGYCNVKFYYNPVTSLLEPIAYDTNAGQYLRRLSVHLTPETEQFWERGIRSFFIGRLFQDQALYDAYISKLDSYARPEFMEGFFSEISKEAEENLKILHSEYPFVKINRSILKSNQSYIRRMLQQDHAVQAYYAGCKSGILSIDAGSAQVMRIEITGVELYGKIFSPRWRYILPERLDGAITYKQVEFSLPDGFVWEEKLSNKLKVHYRIPGLKKSNKKDVYPHPQFNKSLFENDPLRKKTTVGEFDFLSINETNKEIHFRAGLCTIDRDLVIQKGYRVFCHPGTRIDITGSSKIVSSSPFDFRGSVENKIVIYSSDGTGQGLFIKNTQEEESVFNYVVIDGLTSPSHENWSLTGVLTFYEAPVSISGAQFKSCRGEDALNIIRSEFNVFKTRFNRAKSDAIDLDFSNGSVSESDFYQIGNDAIDLAGSTVFMQKLYMDGIGDKGVSVGEKSRADINNLHVKHAVIGVAAKDGSIVRMKNVIIDSSKIGLAAYRKKSEFEAGVIFAEMTVLQAVRKSVDIRAGSRIILNGQEIRQKRGN